MENNVVYLERCPMCDGDGKTQQFYKAANRYISETCCRCEGRLFELSDAGKNLVEFLESMGVVIPDPEGWRKLRE